jgi:hypothetical protein
MTASQHPLAYVSIRQLTSVRRLGDRLYHCQPASVSIRQHTSAHVSEEETRRPSASLYFFCLHPILQSCVLAIFKEVTEVSASTCRAEKYTLIPPPSERDTPSGYKDTFQGSTKLSPVAQMSHWIFVLVQKDSNAKTESFCCTEP